MCRRSSGSGPADRVGDDPCRADNGGTDGVARPVDVIFRPCGEIRNPEQQLEDHDLCGKQARRKRSQDAGEDGHRGTEKAQCGGVGPEHPGGWQPARDRAQQAGHVHDVDDAKGDGANTEEEHEEGLAARKV